MAEKQKQSMDGYELGRPWKGYEIRSLRESLSMDRTQFAALCGISRRTLEAWEGEDKTVEGPAAAVLRLLWEQPQLAEYYAIPPKPFGIRIYYMFREHLCTLIDVDEVNRRVQIRNYTRKLQFRAFGAAEAPDYEDYEAFLESRCFPRQRDKKKLILEELGIPFYDPFLIVKKTQGRMAEDEFWIRMG